MSPWTATLDGPVGRLHALGGERGLRVLSWSAGEVEKAAPDARPDARAPLAVELRRQLEGK